MGLLVIQVLDAVFHLPQEHVGTAQCVSGRLRHQRCAGELLERTQGRSRAQFGELATPDDLQQLDGEFNFTNATPRELDIVAALGLACAALGGMVANLSVQDAQGVKDAVVEVTPEHERRHHAAQALGAYGFYGLRRCHNPAFEPGKTLPLSPLNMEILFQSAQRHHRRSRVAIGAQGQVDPEDKAVLGGVSDQRIDRAHHLAKILLVGDAATTIGVTRRFAILVIDVNQVDVAGDIEFACAQLAHSNDTQIGSRALCGQRRTVHLVQQPGAFTIGRIQCKLGQFGHGAGNRGQRRVVIAIQADQALHHQLADGAQGSASLHPGGLQFDE